MPLPSLPSQQRRECCSLPPVHPPPPRTGRSKKGLHVFHILAPGESLASVAREYGTGVDGIMKLNRITKSAQVYIGMRLHVKEREMTAEELAYDGGKALGRASSPVQKRRPG